MLVVYGLVLTCVDLKNKSYVDLWFFSRLVLRPFLQNVNDITDKIYFQTEYFLGHPVLLLLPRNLDGSGRCEFVLQQQENLNLHSSDNDESD